MEDILLGLLEVLIVDIHPTLPESKQPNFGTDGLVMSTGQFILGKHIVISEPRLY